MTTDYQGNSKKLKAGKEVDVPEKKIEKVIKGEVVVKKKSLSAKIKETFVEADFKSVFGYVVNEVLIPAAREMIVTASTKGVERMIYGDRGPRRGSGYGPTRSSYGGSPLRTDYRSASTRPPSQIGAQRYPRAGRNDYFIETREEAMDVLQMMHDILEMYDEVSVADYNAMLDIPSVHTDEKWGWKNLVDSHVRPTRDGYLIELPPAQPI